MDIMPADERTEALIDELTALWRASVEATHHFLTPAEVERIAAYVPDALRQVPLLATARDDEGRVLGFGGADGDSLEMLFVAPESRGTGVGTALLGHAIGKWGVRRVDVNEQNPAAHGFYEHHGFCVVGRSERDTQGDPYPLLHLALENDGENAGGAASSAGDARAADSPADAAVHASAPAHAAACGTDEDAADAEAAGTPAHAAACTAGASACTTAKGAEGDAATRGTAEDAAGAETASREAAAGTATDAAADSSAWPRVLETERLVLRPWRAEDAEELFALACDPRVGPPAGWPPHRSAEEGRAIIDTVFSAPETWAVTLRDDGRIVGCIGLLFGDNGTEPLPKGEAEVGYWTGAPWWGRGIAPEATRAVQRCAFDELGLSALWCSFDAANRSSRRVAEKCRFVPHHVTEALPRELMGDARDTCFTRLARADWQAAR